MRVLNVDYQKNKTIMRILKYEPRDFVVSGHCLDVLSAFTYVPFALFSISIKVPLQHEIVKLQQQNKSS